MDQVYNMNYVVGIMYNVERKREKKNNAICSVHHSFFLFYANSNWIRGYAGLRQFELWIWPIIDPRIVFVCQTWVTVADGKGI